MPKSAAKKSNNGFTICQFLEGKSFFSFKNEIDPPDVKVTIDFVTVTDPRGLVIHLENGSIYLVAIKKLSSNASASAMHARDQAL
jgi:hypothetical protein